MGRGRAKAKQTKVARDLKYRTHETDFGALAQELHGGPEPAAKAVEETVDEIHAVVRDEAYNEFRDGMRDAGIPAPDLPSRPPLPVLPERWLVVDNGSRDGTGEIVGHVADYTLGVAVVLFVSYAEMVDESIYEDALALIESTS